MFQREIIPIERSWKMHIFEISLFRSPLFWKVWINTIMLFYIFRKSPWSPSTPGFSWLWKVANMCLGTNRLWKWFARARPSWSSSPTTVLLWGKQMCEKTLLRWVLCAHCSREFRGLCWHVPECSETKVTGSLLCNDFKSRNVEMLPGVFLAFWFKEFALEKVLEAFHTW